MMVLFFLTGIGSVNREEWKRAIQKLGITSISDENLIKLHELYDANQNGSLDYKEFIVTLYPVQQTDQEVEQDQQQQQQETQNEQQQNNSRTRRNKPKKEIDSRIPAIMEKIRDKLASRGARGIIGLGKAFRVKLLIKIDC